MTTVRRIVANLQMADPDEARRFYGELLALDVAMDMGWIITFSAEGTARPQVSVMSEGGSEAEVPDISVEVDDVDAVHAKALEMGFEIIRELADEPWGVRRFFVRDPGGRIVNIVAHA